MIKKNSVALKTLHSLLFIIVFSILLSGCQQGKSQQKSQTMKQKDYAIVIHGGAGVISKDIADSTKKAYKDALNKALSFGEDVLKNGGSSLDAVEKVLNYLEDNPRFNAGKGAVYTAKGQHELDAAIMDGNTKQAGAITGVRTVKHPITLARKVMENSRHILFSADGAEAFADEMNVARVKNSYFDTERRYKQWRRAVEESGAHIRHSKGSSDPDFWDADKFGTVGCVALDKNGHLAAGTSTGGLTNKEYGRVGDVPIIGDGTYANSRVAVSCTGIGEEIMRHVTGFHVQAYMEYTGASVQEAADYLIHHRLKTGEAGLIALDQYGNIAMPFNTLGMFRGATDSDGLHIVKIWE